MSFTDSRPRDPVNFARLPIAMLVGILVGPLVFLMLDMISTILTGGTLGNFDQDDVSGHFRVVFTFGPMFVVFFYLLTAPFVFGLWAVRTLTARTTIVIGALTPIIVVIIAFNGADYPGLAAAFAFAGAATAGAVWRMIAKPRLNRSQA